MAANQRQAACTAARRSVRLVRRRRRRQQTERPFSARPPPWSRLSGDDCLALMENSCLIACGGYDRTIRVLELRFLGGAGGNNDGASSSNGASGLGSLTARTASSGALSARGSSGAPLSARSSTTVSGGAMSSARPSSAASSTVSAGRGGTAATTSSVSGRGKDSCSSPWDPLTTAATSRSSKSAAALVRQQQHSSSTAIPYTHPSLPPCCITAGTSVLVPRPHGNSDQVDFSADGAYIMSNCARREQMLWALPNGSRVRT